MYSFLRTIVLHFFDARNFQHGGFLSKIEVFHVLNSIYIKSILLKNKEGITQKVLGFEVNAQNYQFLYILFQEIFIQNHYDFDAKTDTPTIFDCGANIGLAVLFFKMKYPEATIVAFEPSPSAFQFLQLNIERNGLTNVDAQNVALSDRDGETEFFVGGTTASLTGSIIKERGKGRMVKVRCAKLSEYLIRHNPVNLVKMDVEGAEMQVIPDLVSSASISSSGRYIIEYHHNMSGTKYSMADFLRAFENEGFSYSMKSNFVTQGKFQDILLNIKADSES